MAKRKLSDELCAYGYVFSLKKTCISYALIVAFAVGIGLLFHLKIRFLLVLAAVLLFMLPLFLRNLYYNKYEQANFSDVNIYMEQFMYSFMKTGKIYTTLTEVLQLFEKGKMRSTIQNALDTLMHTYGEDDVEAKALSKIEQVYGYDGLNTLHNFSMQVEKNGGVYANCMQLLLEARRMWADRNYERLKERSHQRKMVLVSIATSLLLCEVVAYMASSMNVDVSDKTVCQVVTLCVLILDIGIYYIADKKLSASLIEDEQVDEEDLLKTYERYENYKQMSHPNKMGMRICKRNLTRGIEKVFPKWLMQVSLLLQCENPQVAIFKSYNDAPKLLKPMLSKFIVQLKQEPTSMKPYLNFLGEFTLPEVRSAMKMLYSLSEGTGAKASEQIEDIIRRNQQLMNKAQKLKSEDEFAGMYALFLAPQLTGGLKLMVDMVMLFIVYVAQMVG